jgi:uncharacterized protein (TIGR03435 family)
MPRGVPHCRIAFDPENDLWYYGGAAMKRLVILLTFLSALAYPQSGPAARKTFDVVSIRQLARPSLPNLERFPGGHQMAASGTLAALIQGAFNAPFDTVQIKDKEAADWARRDDWIVQAKSEDAFSQIDMQAMLQDVLIQRFKLNLNRGEQPGVNYVLTVDQKRFKGVKESDPQAASSVRVNSTQEGSLFYEVTATTMAQFVFSGPFWNLRAPVYDATGLEDRYSFRWVLREPGGDGGASPDNITYTLRKLGLILTEKKGMIPTIMVTHAEKPTEN